MRYLKIGESFVIHHAGAKQERVGAVVASQDALFLCSYTTLNRIVVALLVDIAAVPGVGRIFNRWAEKLSKPSSPPGSRPLAELPEAITEDPEWPVSFRKGEVIVLPKRVVSGIRFSFSRALEVSTTVGLFTVRPLMFQGRKSLKELESLGWKVERGAGA